MKTHILCLSLIFIISSIHPFALLQSFTMFPGMEKIDKKKYFETGFLVVVALIFGSSVLLIEDMRRLEGIKGDYRIWGVYVIILVFAIIGIEVGVEFLRIKIKGEKVSNIEIIGDYKGRSFCTLLTVGGIALLEELIYRKLWFLILGNYFHINIWIVLIISAVVYAMNHKGMGNEVPYQKVFSGLIFGGIYVISGTILIPICIHVLQNILIILVGRR